jgi:1-phosphofructokinase family hexose kinase
MPGGKGVNVARAIKRLGGPVIATGLAGGATGTRIVEALNDEAVLNAFVRIRDESRTNTAVLDPTTGLQTEINERGPAVAPQELELFHDKLQYLAKGASICVFAGSLPRGMDPAVYADLIRDVKRLGVTTILDTDGEPLRLAMRAEPDIVSPNELEAEELVGQEFNDLEDRAQAVLEMSRLGAREAVMTVRDGCYAHVLDDGHALYRVSVPEQEARSPPAGRVPARPPPGAARRSNAFATQSRAERSRFSTLVPASSIPAGSSGCWRRSRLSGSSSEPRSGSGPAEARQRNASRGREISQGAGVRTARAHNPVASIAVPMDALIAASSVSSANRITMPEWK